MSDGLPPLPPFVRRPKPGRPGLRGGAVRLTISLDRPTHERLVEIAVGRPLAEVIRDVLAAGLAAQDVEHPGGDVVGHPPA